MADTKQAAAEVVRCEHCGKPIREFGITPDSGKGKCWVHADGKRRRHIATPRTQPSQTEELKPPRHAFEVRIAIGGNDWDYVLRTMDELAGHIREHGPECGLSSGGWGGSHSIYIEKRDVTPEVYHDELEKWRIARLDGGR